MNHKNEQHLSCIKIEPSVSAKRSVIWLHGLGADGNDFVPIVPELKLPSDAGVRFIFPHAPVMPITINSGYEMRAWYDIASPNLGQDIDQTNISRSIKLVEKLIEQEKNLGIALENIVLAGFSQGAVIALLTSLMYPIRLGGTIALSGYLPFAQQTLARASTANQALPIFIAHGTEDILIPCTLGKAAFLALEQANYQVTWHTYPMPHAVCAEEIRDLSLWLQQLW